jgi:uncharacterized protein YggE
MRKILLFTVVALALILSACAPAMPQQGAVQQQPAEQPALQVVQGQPRTISVNGTGQVTVSPDVAYIYVGVHSQSGNVSTALEENNAKAQAVSAALQELGIAAEDIQTSGFNIYPQQQYGPQGELLETSLYSVDNAVYVTVRNLQIMGQMLEVVVTNGANSINGITFDVLDKSQSIAEARRLAIESARSQAAAAAEAAGETLGELHTLTVYSTGTVMPLYDGRGGMIGIDASQVPVAAGQMQIRVEVNAVYTIE